MSENKRKTPPSNDRGIANDHNPFRDTPNRHKTYDSVPTPSRDGNVVSNRVPPTDPPPRPKR